MPDDVLEVAGDEPVVLRVATSPVVDRVGHEARSAATDRLTRQ